jgi:hypothetical protein
VPLGPIIIILLLLVVVVVVVVVVSWCPLMIIMIALLIY